jgi:hypothetical protein
MAENSAGLLGWVWHTSPHFLRSFQAVRKKSSTPSGSFFSFFRRFRKNYPLRPTFSFHFSDGSRKNSNSVGFSAPFYQTV